MIDFKSINEAASKMGQSAAAMVDKLDDIASAQVVQTDFLEEIRDFMKDTVRVLGDIERGINSLDGKTPLR